VGDEPGDKTKVQDPTGKTSDADGKNADKGGKPDEASKKYTADQVQDSFDAGKSKGVETGKTVAQAELLKELGIENLDDAKSALAEGKKAQDALDETKTASIKALNDAKVEFDEKVGEIRKAQADYVAKIEPVFKKAEEKEKKEEQEGLFKALKVPEDNYTLLRGMLKLEPKTNDEESDRDHIERVLQLQPRLTIAEAKPQEDVSEIAGGGPAHKDNFLDGLGKAQKKLGHVLPGEKA